MSSTKEYKDFILEQTRSLNVTSKPMMGEYLLYYQGILFGGLYDDRLLVKINDNNKKCDMEEAIPYDGAKPMFLVKDVDNEDVLKDIIIDTYEGLK